MAPTLGHDRAGCAAEHGWEVVPLGDTCEEFFSGGTPSTRYPEYWAGDIPWTTSAHIDGPRLGSGCKTISAQGVASSASRVVPAGNLLIGTRVGVGKSATNLLNVAISQDLTAGLVREDRFSAEFLALQLRTARCQSFFGLQKRGATIKGIPREDLLKLEMAAPPLAEQKVIAAELFRIHRRLELEELRRAALQELKAAMMARVFREGLHGEALRPTSVGELPRSWRTAAIGEHADVGNGSTPNRSTAGYWEGGVHPWITSTKVHAVFITSADEFVTEQARRECHLPLVPSGSLVVAITGQGKTLGHAAMVRFNTHINQHLAYIRFKDGQLLPEFLLYYLQSRYGDLREAAQAGGTTKGALTCCFLRHFTVPVPEPTEQQKIAELLGALTQRLAVATQRLRSLQDLFRSSLDALMTGQLRVTPLLEKEVADAG